MVGTPAATSITTPSMAASQAGAYSVRMIEIAMESGTASTSAKAVVMIVPTRKVSAPYTSVAGFQVVPVKMLRPSLPNAGQAVAVTTATMAASVTTITMATARVTHR